jgi:asparagine synthase (glutamine-hydrolysing)
MCSFLFLHLKKKPSKEIIDSSNVFAQRRGPDKTNIIVERDPYGYYNLFLHNLLDISGTACVQPFLASNAKQTITLFNGEIYNHVLFANTRSDTESIPIAFESYDSKTGSILDGEFAILIYDKNNASLNVFTDPFLTKPVFFGYTCDPAEIGVATCESSLRLLGFTSIVAAQPNSAYHFLFGANSLRLEHQLQAFPFDTKQHVHSFEQWEASFLSAVEKRAKHGAHLPVVYLSSGYDSGAICLALNLLGIKYETFSIAAVENREILNKRLDLNKHASCNNSYVYDYISDNELASIINDIKSNVENFKYSHEDSPGNITCLHDDSGAIGANFIAKRARELGRIVTLSGCGADEIMSDYGFGGKKFYYHSEFGGLFPDSLENFFPWKKFYGDTMRSYLFKDEYILGRYGIEGRYPFLDRAVVQQFLSLSPELKNSAYKAPLKYFFDKYNYPYEEGRKRGFSPVPTQQFSVSNSFQTSPKSTLQKILEKLLLGSPQN